MLLYIGNNQENLVTILYNIILWHCTVCSQGFIDYLLSVLSWLLLCTGLLAPANVVAKAETCDIISLQWTQPTVPNDITPSVSCTPPSPGCAGCTTSPCTITGLNPSIEYVFTVTLNSVMCGTSMNTTGIGTRGEKFVKEIMTVDLYFEHKNMSILMASVIFMFSQD